MLEPCLRRLRHIADNTLLRHRFCFGWLLVPAWCYGQTAAVKAPAEAPSVISVSASAEAITARLEHAYHAFLELPLAWEPTQDVLGSVIVSPVDIGQREAWKGNWDRMAALLRSNGGRPYAARLQVVNAKSKKRVWQQRLPIEPVPLAEATRRLPPDATHIANNIDVPATLPFRIPAGTLKVGLYRVILSFTAPDGSEHVFPGGSTLEGADLLLIRSLARERILLSGQIVEAPEPFFHAVEIGNPGRQQFPGNDANDCQARSVWCLQEFEGRVYVGYGDWDRNRGPIAVWNFAPNARQTAQIAALPPRFRFAASHGLPFTFVQEFVVQEESIDRFRVCGDALVIPGIDGNKEYGPEGFLFGNVYVRQKGCWRKISSVPNGKHVYDALVWRGKLLAAGLIQGTWVVSDDNGLSWRPVGAGVEEVGDGEMAPVGDAIWLFGYNGTCVYRNGRLTRHISDLFPGSVGGTAYRVTPFAGGVVYTTFHHWGESKDPRHPLFFLRNPDEGAKIVSVFENKTVRDILVEGDTLSVLVAGAPTDNGGFPGEIYSTHDLKTWARVAAFTLPATPSAFTRLDNRFYVGTANRGYNAAAYGANTAVHNYAYADREAGSLWQLGP